MVKALVVAAAVAASTLVAASTASSAASTTWTVERYLTGETWHAFANVGTAEAGPDDVYAAQQFLKTPGGKPVGIVAGYGINLHKPYVFFHWTAVLGSDSLTLEGAVSLRSKTQSFAIVGGTGRYAGARGTVTITPAGKDDLAVVRYRI